MAHCDCGGYFGAHATSCSARAGKGSPEGLKWWEVRLAPGSCNCGGPYVGKHSPTCPAGDGSGTTAKVEGDSHSLGGGIFGGILDVGANRREREQEARRRAQAEADRGAEAEQAWWDGPSKTSRRLDKLDAVLGFLEGRENREARPRGGGRGWWRK